MSGTEIAQMIMDQDGYIVIGSAELHEIGQVLEHDLSPSLDRTELCKVVVVGTANCQDFIRQTLKVDPKYQWQEIPTWAARFHFYKVLAE